MSAWLLFLSELERLFRRQMQWCGSEIRARLDAFTDDPDGYIDLLQQQGRVSARDAKLARGLLFETEIRRDRSRGMLSKPWRACLYRYPARPDRCGIDSGRAMTKWGANRCAKRLVRKWTESEPA